MADPFRYFYRQLILLAYHKTQAIKSNGLFDCSIIDITFEALSNPERRGLVHHYLYSSIRKTLTGSTTPKNFRFTKKLIELKMHDASPEFSSTDSRRNYEHSKLHRSNLLSASVLSKNWTLSDNQTCNDNDIFFLFCQCNNLRRLLQHKKSW